MWNILFRLCLCKNPVWVQFTAQHWKQLCSRWLRNARAWIFYLLWLQHSGEVEKTFKHCISKRQRFRAGTPPTQHTLIIWWIMGNTIIARLIGLSRFSKSKIRFKKGISELTAVLLLDSHLDFVRINRFVLCSDNCHLHFPNSFSSTVGIYSGGFLWVRVRQVQLLFTKKKDYKV